MVSLIALLCSFAITLHPYNFCRKCLLCFLIAFREATRLVFMATFAVIVFIIVKYGEVPKKCFVITSIIVVAVLWMIVFLGTAPLFSHTIIYTWYTGSLSCGFIPIAASCFLHIYLLDCFYFSVVSLHFLSQSQSKSSQGLSS